MASRLSAMCPSICPLSLGFGVHCGCLLLFWRRSHSWHSNNCVVGSGKLGGGTCYDHGKVALSRSGVVWGEVPQFKEDVFLVMDNSAEGAQCPETHIVVVPAADVEGCPGEILVVIKEMIPRNVDGAPAWANSRSVQEGEAEGVAQGHTESWWVKMVALCDRDLCRSGPL